MAKIPQTLKEAILKKKVVPFVGAGVSMAVIDKNTNKALFPSWKEFVVSLAERLRNDDFESDAKYVEAAIDLNPPKYLQAIGHAKGRLGGEWFKCLMASFNPPQNRVVESSLKLPKLIWRISDNLVITTNVDRVLEWSSPGPADILDGQNVEFAELTKVQNRPANPTVLHLHGHVSNKAKVIFTEEQFSNFYEKNENLAKLQTLLNVLTGRTLLFVGYGLGDEHFIRQLNHIHDIYQGGADSYYILLHKKYDGNKNLPEFVRPIYVEDYATDLIETLEEMAEIEDDIERFKRIMPGMWEYTCEVDGNDTFDGKTVERGGVMNFKVIDQPLKMFGFEIQIDAQRLWSREVDGKEIVLTTGLPWQARGAFGMWTDGKYTFEYTFTDVNTRGETKDSYFLGPDGIRSGTFVHIQEHPGVTPKPYKVTGVVKARPMTQENDLQWLPSGAK